MKAGSALCRMVSALRASWRAGGEGRQNDLEEGKRLHAWTRKAIGMGFVFPWAWRSVAGSMLPGFFERFQRWYVMRGAIRAPDVGAPGMS